MGTGENKITAKDALTPTYEILKSLDQCDQYSGCSAEEIYGVLREQVDYLMRVTTLYPHLVHSRKDGRSPKLLVDIKNLAKRVLTKLASSGDSQDLPSDYNSLWDNVLSIEREIIAERASHREAFGLVIYNQVGFVEVN